MYRLYIVNHKYIRFVTYKCEEGEVIASLKLIGFLEDIAVGNFLYLKPNNLFMRVDAITESEGGFMVVGPIMHRHLIPKNIEKRKE